MSDPSDSPGATARALLQADIKKAEAAFSGFQTQSLTVVGVSGGLLTLVTGFLALAGLKEDTAVPGSAKTLIFFALAAYVLAAISALLVYLPGWVNSIDGEKFQAYLDENWDAGEEAWAKAAADLELEYLQSLQSTNSKVVKFYITAVVLEVIGIALTGWAALNLLGTL